MSESAHCAHCGRTLVPDEIGATKLCIDKFAEEFYCLTCLAKRFSTTEDYLQSRIDFLRAHGCVLFP